MSRRIAISAGMALLASAAASSMAAADAARGVRVRPARVLDVRSGALRDGVLVRIEGDRIASIGAADAELVDVTQRGP